MTQQLSTDYPHWKSHKIVQAFQIAQINHAPDGGAALSPADTKLASVQVNADWVKKHNPQVGGFYVIYGDGYASYSPEQAFIDGYSLLPDYQVRIIAERDELKKKLNALDSFIASSRAFADLPAFEQEDLRTQYTHMVAYLMILNQRIGRF